jgi:predicted metalloprotease
MMLGGGLGGIVVLLIALLLGADPRQLLEQVQVDGGPGSVSSTDVPAGLPPEADELAQFVSVVLAETEDVWGELFREGGEAYREPTLVLFSDYVQSACGIAGAAVGPFYCPGDAKLYIDLTFYDDLRSRFGAPGDFAQAYVIAHEVGHHVQNLLGTADQVRSMQSRGGEREANRLSVRMELQADFYAGVWAHHAAQRGILEAGDIEEALAAASAIGDDRLQRQSQGTIVPDSFTHGTAEQRMRWFRHGYETGDPEAGDTFSVSEEDL